MVPLLDPARADEGDQAYLTELRPVLEHYAEEGVLVAVDGSASPEELWQDIEVKLPYE